MWKRLRAWHQGEYVPPENDPTSNLVFIVGRYKRPHLAQILDATFNFYLRNWKWCIGTTIAIVALVFQLARR